MLESLVVLIFCLCLFGFEVWNSSSPVNPQAFILQPVNVLRQLIFIVQFSSSVLLSGIIIFNLWKHFFNQFLLFFLKIFMICSPVTDFFLCFFKFELNGTQICSLFLYRDHFTFQNSQPTQFFLMSFSVFSIYFSVQSLICDWSSRTAIWKSAFNSITLSSDLKRMARDDSI